MERTNLSDIPINEVVKSQLDVFGYINSLLANRPLQRTPLYSPRCEYSCSGGRFKINQITSPFDPNLIKVHHLLEKNIKSSSIDEIDIFRAGVEGNTEGRYKVFYARDIQSGEISSATVGVHYEMKDQHNNPSGNLVYIRAYSATNEFSRGGKPLRQSGLGTQLSISAYIDSAIDAHLNNKKLTLTISEALPSTEAYLNRLGLKRAYLGDDLSFRELPLFVPNPNNPSEISKEKLHLMFARFDSLNPTQDDVLGSVKTHYRWYRHADPAKKSYNRALDRLWENSRVDILSYPQMIFLNKQERESSPLSIQPHNFSFENFKI